MPKPTLSSAMPLVRLRAPLLAAVLRGTVMRAYGLPPRLPAVDLPCSVLCVAIGCGAEASPARPFFFFDGSAQ